MPVAAGPPIWRRPSSPHLDDRAVCRSSEENVPARHPRRAGRPDGARTPAGRCRSNIPASPPSISPCAPPPALFDVSHMGEIEIAGKDALAAVQHISSNDASRLQVNQAHYAALTHAGRHVRGRHARLPLRAEPLPAGRQRQQRREGLRLDCEAAPKAGDVAVVNSSSRYALIAVQGPKALQIVQSLTAIDLVGHQVLLVRARRGGRRPRARCRAPVTPARTASRFSVRRRWRRACGTRS